MPRPRRVTEPGTVYHLLNRRVMRLTLFEKPGDYAAFERVLAESLMRRDAPRLLAYCLMPNHWHLVVQAGRRSDLSTWMQWVTVTHAHRWHAHFHSTGEGPLYQGRFKSFPVQEDSHFLTVCRYVEANALRAGLTRRAEDWRWGSADARLGRSHHPAMLCVHLGEWPIERPRNWLAELNRAASDEDLKEVRCCAVRGRPLGTDSWRAKTATRLGLNLTLHPRGRPRRADGK